MKLITAAAIFYLLWILQSIFWHRFWRQGLSASVTFTDSAVIEGDTTTLKEVITNNKFLPLPILHVKFQMGRELLFAESGNSKITDQNYRSDIFSCMPWQEIRRMLTIQCSKRGYYTIQELDLVSYDLFQTNHFAVSVPVDTALYVYPAAADPRKLQLPLTHLQGQILAKRALLRDPFEMQSVRPYQTYDTFRDINWKATARTGSLKVNVHAPTASWQAAFLLDVEMDALWKDYALIEEAIRICASLSQELLHQNIPVALITNGIDCLYQTPAHLDMGTGSSHMRSILELLSRIIVDTHGSMSQPMAGRCGDVPAQPFHLEEYLEQRILYAPQHSNAETTIYILISTRQQERLIQLYSALCRKSQGSQWIMPHRPKDLPDPSLIPPHIHFFQWEVPYAYT